MIEVTTLHCTMSGAAEGQDNSTHHLVPRAAKRGARGQREQVCIYCEWTEKELREAAERNGKG